MTQEDMKAVNEAARQELEEKVLRPLAELLPQISAGKLFPAYGEHSPRLDGNTTADPSSFLWHDVNTLRTYLDRAVSVVGHSPELTISDLRQAELLLREIRHNEGFVASAQSEAEQTIKNVIDALEVPFESLEVLAHRNRDALGPIPEKNQHEKNADAILDTLRGIHRIWDTHGYKSAFTGEGKNFSEHKAGTSFQLRTIYLESVVRDLHKASSNLPERAKQMYSRAGETQKILQEIFDNPALKATEAHTSRETRIVKIFDETKEAFDRAFDALRLEALNAMPERVRRETLDPTASRGGFNR